MSLQVTAGKLKLKGGLSLGGKKKKSKKKKKKRKKDPEEENSTTATTSTTKRAKIKDTRTAAEKNMDERLRIREEQELRKNVQSGYREKVDKFNRHLESLTEHNDIPKVGNAGCG